MIRCTAAQIQADFERVDAQCTPYVARNRYEATCIAAGHSWEGQLTWIQGLALRIVGAKCGWCGSMMVVEPVLMGSIGSVTPTTRVRAIAMKLRGGMAA